MKCKICNKNVKNIKSLMTHIRRAHLISSEVYYLKYIGVQGTCEICGCNTKYQNITHGYSKSCKNHSALYAGLQMKKKVESMTPEEKLSRANNISKKYHEKSSDDKNAIKEKRISTNIKNHGVENVMQNEKISEKLKHTIEKHSPEIKNKIQNKRISTTMARYQVDHVSKLDYVKDMCKNTKKEKYKDEYFNNMQKIKKTKLERYGDENFNNREQAQATREMKYGKICFSNTDIGKKTKLERYGDENFNNREKCSHTKLERYGNENFNNSEQTWVVRMKSFYQSFFTTDRLKGLVTPVFSFNEYCEANRLHNKHKFRCNKCNHEFFDYVKNGAIPRCKKCYPINASTSKSEKEIVYYLQNELHIERIIENSRSIITPLELDIYLPDYKLAIEFNGLYWHSELNGVTKNYHLNKTELCEKQGIQLIHIFEDEWCMKNELVKQKLKAILKCNSEKIYARNCIIKEVTSKEKNIFLESYHIQGQDKSSVKLGAFYKNELIGIITFGGYRKAMGGTPIQSEYELIRLCTKYTVIGLADKFVKHFIKNYNPVKIISYADRRWTKSFGNVYEKIGFTKVSDGVPNYWYMGDCLSKREHRFNYRKQVLSHKLDSFDPNLTEWENMKNNGYTRVWDCGSLKYELQLKDQIIGI